MDELSDGSKKRKLSEKAYTDSRTLCKQLLSNLMKHQFSWPFNQPVDPVALKLHDYMDKISHPMDFSTIMKKIELSSYSESEDFAVDVRLVFQNCRTYNDANSDIVYMANSLSKLFEEQYMEIKRRESKIIDNHEIGEMKGVINDLRNEHQKLLAELQKLVKNASSPNNQQFVNSKSTPPGSVAGNGSGRRGRKPKSISTKVASPPPVPLRVVNFDYQMKELLSTKIGSLSEDNLQKMAQFLSSELKELPANGEVELDLEKLSDETLTKLDDFVNVCLKEQTQTQTQSNGLENHLESQNSIENGNLSHAIMNENGNGNGNENGHLNLNLTDRNDENENSDSDSDSSSSSDSESDNEEIIVN